MPQSFITPIEYYFDQVISDQCEEENSNNVSFVRHIIRNIFEYHMLQYKIFMLLVTSNNGNIIMPHTILNTVHGIRIRDKNNENMPITDVTLNRFQLRKESNHLFRGQLK